MESKQRRSCGIADLGELADQVNGTGHQGNGGGTANQCPHQAAGLLADQTGQQLEDHGDDERRHHDDNPPARQPFDGRPLGIIDVRDTERTGDEGPDPGRDALENVREERRDGTLDAVVRLGDETATGRPPSVQVALNRHD